jgi:DNA-directed RNA polymerase subunit M/transcription elongation factor TFIIS
MADTVTSKSSDEGGGNKETTKEIPKKKRAYRRKKKSKTKDSVKYNYRELFVQRLVEKCKFIKRVGKEIEQSVYDYVVVQADKRSLPYNFENRIFRNLYFDKSRSIYVNLSTNSYVNNNSLRERLKTKEIKPSEVAFLDPQHMHPDNWKLLVEERDRRYKMLYEVRDDEISGVFQCGKCKSWKTHHSEAQTRSADEPMTVFVKCYGCGAHWKQ